MNNKKGVAEIRPVGAAKLKEEMKHNFANQLQGQP